MNCVFLAQKMIPLKAFQMLQLQEKKRKEKKDDNAEISKLMVPFIKIKEAFPLLDIFLFRIERNQGRGQPC